MSSGGSPGRLARSRPLRLAAAGGASLLGLLLLVRLAGVPVLAPVKSVAKRWLGQRALEARRAQRSDDAFFSRLAASQVGYPPGAPKEFTSPRPFGAFEVRREPDGAVAFRGGPPARVVATDLLGPLRQVWVGDFGALAAPGRYRVVADNGLESFPFEIGPGVFDAAVRAVQRSFYYQRAFTASEAPWAEGPWVHPSDARLAPPGVRGGWRDAGDYSIYNASATSALFWLLEAWADFAPAADDTGIPESGNGVPDLLDEARVGLEWMLSVQAPSGGFANTTCQDRYRRYGDNALEDMPPYRLGEVGTIATGRAVGTLASASVAFRPFDPAFAERCLLAARRGEAWLEARPGENSDGPTCPAYRQDGNAQAGREARMYAAAGLLLATGEPRFRELFEASYEELWNDTSGYRTNGYAMLVYLRAPAGDPARKAHIRDRFAAHAAGSRADAARNPFHWPGRYFWGSVAAGFHRVGASAAKRCLASRSANAADCALVLDALHYAFGRNSLQLSYVSGLPGVTRARTRAFHHWLATLRATPFLFPGLVAGGPSASPVRDDVSFPHARPFPVWGYFGDPAMPRDDSTPLDARYTDNDSWSTNEISMDWQAVGLYVLEAGRWLASTDGDHPGGGATRH